METEPANLALWAINSLLGVIMLLGGAYMRRLVEDQRTAHSETRTLAKDFQAHQVAAAEHYVTRASLNELVIGRLDRLERKIDRLLSNGRRDEEHDV